MVQKHKQNFILLYLVLKSSGWNNLHLVGMMFWNHFQRFVQVQNFRTKACNSTSTLSVLQPKWASKILFAISISYCCSNHLKNIFLELWYKNDIFSCLPTLCKQFKLRSSWINYISIYPKCCMLVIMTNTQATA